VRSSRAKIFHPTPLLPCTFTTLRRTAHSQPYRSGIWRDLAVRHRPTEVPTHYGAVLATAETVGVPTPLVRELLDQIRQLEGGAVMSEERLDELNRVAA